MTAQPIVVVMRSGGTLIVGTMRIRARAIIGRMLSAVTLGFAGDGLIRIQRQGTHPHAGEYTEHEEP